MSVRITDNSDQIKATVKQRLSLFLRFVIDDVDRTADPKTPRKTGELRNLKRKQVLGTHGVLAWRRSYAPIQELTQFRNYTTPGTGPHFAKNAVRAVLGRAEQHARRAGL